MYLLVILIVKAASLKSPDEDSFSNLLPLYKTDFLHLFCITYSEITKILTLPPTVLETLSQRVNGIELMELSSTPGSQLIYSCCGFVPVSVSRKQMSSLHSSVYSNKSIRGKK